jgi:hypothetical protein
LTTNNVVPELLDCVHETVGRKNDGVYPLVEELHHKQKQKCERSYFCLCFWNVKITRTCSVSGFARAKEYSQKCRTTTSCETALQLSSYGNSVC